MRLDPRSVPSTTLDGAPALVGSLLAGRYRVDRLLGEGGMGRVYLAEHVLMRKPVALKVLHPELTAVPDVIARFEREAVAAARIDHANVAQAMDFGRLDDGSLYFVLEYVAGRSLRAVLDEGALGLERTLPIARQVASALVAAHKVGIVHRDLKPDNVMLVPQADGSDRVKVLDFGIAKVSSDGPPGAPAHTLTRIGVVMGTVGYMSPEQALGQAVDHLADLYAFGAMLYEMLSGHLPFEAEEVAQLLAKQLTEQPPPLPEEVPPELARLVNTLLAKTPSERTPSNAAELLEALDGLAERTAAAGAATAFMEAPPAAALASGANDGAASARVTVARTQTDPAVRRRPVLFATSAAVVLIAGLGLARWRSSSTPEAARGASSEAPASTNAPASTAPPSAARSDVPAPASSPEAAVVSGLPAAAASPSAPPSSEARGAELRPARVSAETATSHTQSSTTESTSSERGGVTTTHKSKHSRSEERTVKRTKRHTGPGGIYIPPPSQWFK